MKQVFGTFLFIHMYRQPVWVLIILPLARNRQINSFAIVKSMRLLFVNGWWDCSWYAKRIRSQAYFAFISLFRTFRAFHYFPLKLYKLRYITVYYYYYCSWSFVWLSFGIRLVFWFSASTCVFHVCRVVIVDVCSLSLLPLAYIFIWSYRACTFFYACPHISWIQMYTACVSVNVDVYCICVQLNQEHLFLFMSSVCR